MADSWDPQTLCLSISSSLRDGTVDWSRAEQWAEGVQQGILARLQSIESLETSAPPDVPIQTPWSPLLGEDERIAGRYRIDRFVDRGGMGEVYRAFDELLEVPVALKTLSPRTASDLASLQQFKREVLLARSITHPNVCRIYDLGWDEGRNVTYVTMEFLEGETLRDRIRDGGPLAPDEALPILTQIADGLTAAHRLGVIHRDLKSSNIMLVENTGDERAVILDFGLAQQMGQERASDSQVATSTKPSEVPGRIVGTPAYMAPEQVTLGELSPASDLYALGIVIFEVITGKLPFEYPTPLELALAHVNDQPPSPREFVEVETRWEDAILKLLAKTPVERFETAQDVVDTLSGRAESEERTYVLPGVNDAFVGRAQELDFLARELETRRGPVIHPGGRKGTARPSRPAPLLTLLGPGGSGKTRLAIEYAWESLTRWPGGVWYCDLTNAETLDGIAFHVAEGLGVALGGGDPLAQLGRALASRGKALVIFDNFEHLVEHAEASVGRWREDAREASFLVTSRSKLHIDGEFVLNVEPLETGTTAIELFATRAQEHRPGFELDDETRTSIENIVQALEGLPLSIELAAARLRLLTAEQIRNRLTDQFRLLAGGKQGRHASLRSTLDWSWDLLEVPEREVISQASVFEGGFTLDAAEQVLRLPDSANSPDILDLVQSLLDKSWLHTTVHHGVPRFDMYVAIKEYASEKLGDAARRVDERHGRYFAALGTQENLESLFTHGGVQRRKALNAELDNLVRACHHAIACNDADVATATYRAVCAVLDRKGPFRVPYELGRAVLNILQDSVHLAPVLFEMGSAAQSSGNLTEARQLTERARTLFLGLDDRRNVGITTAQLGLFQLQQGEIREGDASLRRALVIFEELGDLRSQGRILINLSGLSSGPEEARRCLESALALHRRTGDRRAEGITHARLATNAHNWGSLEDAERHYLAALEIHRETDNRRHEGVTLGDLGLLYYAQGRLVDAHRLLQQALQIPRDSGDMACEAIILSQLASVYETQGWTEKTEQALHQALDLHRQVGNRMFEGMTLEDLARVSMAKQDPLEARRFAQEALSLARSLESPKDEALALTSLGAAAWQDGNTAEGRRHLHDALEICTRVEYHGGRATALQGLARLAWRSGHLEDARKYLDESLAILETQGRVLQLLETQILAAEFELEVSGTDRAREAFVVAESTAHKCDFLPDCALELRLDKIRQALL